MPLRPASRINIGLPMYHAPMMIKPGFEYFGSRNHSGCGKCKDASTLLSRPRGLRIQTHRKMAATPVMTVGM